MENQENYILEDKLINLIETLKARFNENLSYHPYIKWEEVESKLRKNREKLIILYDMEITQGSPDVVSYNKDSDEYIFFDCSKESPSGRRSLCYDREAIESRKANKPKTSAIEMAKKMKVEILNEEQYRMLQSLGDFDTKTSSWVKTPDRIRKLGGALFCDRRYDTVFTYHNSAQSYYSSRGFRAFLVV